MNFFSGQQRNACDRYGDRSAPHKYRKRLTIDCFKLIHFPVFGGEAKDMI